jgi:hypothetical protein
MHFLHAWSQEIKGRLGDSSLEDWASLLESSPGETTRATSRVSLPERIAASSRTPRGLAVICTLWIAFLLGLVFAFIRLT